MGKTVNKRNYQRELDQIIDKQCIKEGYAPTLLLHGCCAPCSSYVLEYLSQFFRITELYYNPNIYPESEYARRVNELHHLLDAMKEKNVSKYPVNMVEGRFSPDEFYEAVRGLEHIREGGERCFACFRLRLRETAKMAAEGKYDYFTTTLTISPLKNAEKLNEIGEEAAEEYHVRWLPCDFKKKDGYKRSTELSAEYGLYRQNYCGCVFSMQERGLQEINSCGKL